MNRVIRSALCGVALLSAATAWLIVGASGEATPTEVTAQPTEIVKLYEPFH